MTAYVIFAIFLILTVIYAPVLNERSKKLLYTSIGILFVIFLILRHPTVNKDYGIYQRIYDLVPSTEVLKESLQKYNDEADVEITYALMCTILKETGNSKIVNFWIIFAIYAILGVSIKMKVFKRLTDLEFLTLYIYFCNLFLLHEATQVRAGIALGLLLLSIHYIVEDKYWQFFLTIFIAFFFHTSAAMGLLIFIFKGIRCDARIWCGVFILCILIAITQFNILNIIEIIPFDYYQYKLKAYILLQDRENFHINFFNIQFLLQNFIILLCFFYQEQLEKVNPHFNILLNMCCLSSCCFLFFSQIPGFAMRISEVYNCGLVILIPLLTKVIKPKILANSTVILIGLLLFYINVFHSGLVQQYKFFFE